MHNRGYLMGTLAMAMLIWGCGPPPAIQNDPPAERVEPPADNGPVDATADRPVDTTTDRPATPDDAQADALPEEPAPRPAPAQASDEMSSRQKAAPGVGKKGRGYGGDYISEVAKAYFGTRQRIVFQIQIPQAINTYKASDPRGEGPKNHEEFIEKVIKQNGLQLPDLPDGWKYEYDPEEEELMVLRPKM
jgi:hypothetical protein